MQSTANPHQEGFNVLLKDTLACGVLEPGLELPTLLFVLLAEHNVAIGLATSF